MISEFALFVFTLVGGAGAGLYAASAVFAPEGKRGNLVVTVVPLALLALGGVALLLHLGHPERMLNALANPSAGITLEGYACGVFGVLLVADLALTALKGQPPRALRIVGALAAVALCTAMGYAYYLYEAVVVWHALPTFALFLVCDLALGIQLLGAVSAETARQRGFGLVSAVLTAGAAVAFALESAVFGGAGFSVMPFWSACALAAFAALAAFVDAKLNESWLRWGGFVLLTVGTFVARYAFYSVV